MADGGPMPLAIDASVAFKWFVPEDGRDRALALLDGDEPLWAPDLVLAEVGNALFGRLRTMSEGRDVAATSVRALSEIYSRLVPARELVPRALEIAFDLRHPIYDCVYLAMCEMHDIVLITADQRLIAAADGTPHSSRLRIL